MTGFLPCFVAGVALLVGTMASRAAGTGLTGDYYDNADFTTLKATRIDPVIDFDWGAAAPTNTMGADSYSVRWSGQVEPRYSETYTFYVTADDGARLWVNDRLILVRTTYSLAAMEMAGRINLVAGQRCNLRLEFIEGSGNAQVKLEWSSASQAREVVPQSQLYPTLMAAERGSLLVEHWMNLPGTNVGALTAYANFPNRPDGREFLVSFECLQTNWTDNFGSRASGYIVPPTNGTYVFAVAGDDSVQLFLSNSTNAAGKQLIASNNVPTGFRQWSNLVGQISAPVTLNGQEKYYVELLHKEGAGNDHFSVAWITPLAANFTVIGADALVQGGLDRAAPAQTAWLDTLCPSHPRLLASPERFEWLKRTLAAGSISQLNSWWGTVSNSASSILTQPVNVYNQDVRGTILAVSRSVVDRVYKCALTYWITGDTNFAERAWAELDQVCSTNFPDWHPAHFLDTAEMTHACAVGYDWLYNYWTPERRTTIRTAIVNKGLSPSLTLYTNNSSWVASSANNWNLVCNGGMIMGALAVGTESEAVAEYVLYKAVASASAVMKHYTTDNGGWYEGPGYWDYTTDYNMHLMASLESALGSDFGLSLTRNVWETGMEPIYMVGPTKLSFNFADAGAGNMRGSQLLWIARRYNRPETAWWERNNASAEPLDLLWYDTRGSDPQAGGLRPDNYFRGPTGTTAYFPADALTLRTRWQDSDASFLGFKAGEVGASHGHLDAGGFVFDALGVRWAHDLGGDDYALPGYFSEPQRWTYYRLRAEGHNTLVINPGANADQIVGAKPPVVLYTSEPNTERAATVADLTSAYGITKVWRGVQLLQGRRWALIQDELEAASPANVWWFMHINPSTSAVIDTNGVSATLTQGTDRLWVSILAGGGSFTLSNAVPLPTSPNPSGQNTNNGYRKLAIHLTNVTSTTLAVLLVPLSPGQSAPTNLPALVPLSDWGAGTTNSVIVPTNTPPAATVTNLTTMAGAFVDIDLLALAGDAETAATNLLLSLGATANGTVVLRPDGHTARFTPAANFSGVASFKFSVGDTWPDPRLEACYDFEPPQSTADGWVPDMSGHGFFGQITNAGAGTNYLVADVPAALTNRSRQSLLVRESGDFNGARLITPIMPADLDFNFHDWTIAGWFKRAATTNDDFIFYLGNSDGFGSPDEFHLYGASGNNNLILRHYIGTSTTDLDITAPNIAPGQWHHAAVSFQSTNGNSGVVRFYLDGALVGTDSSVTFNLPSGSLCIFGGHASATFAVSRWFNGRLDDLAVFNTALGTADVAQIAARPVAYLGGLWATNTVWINVLPVNHAPVLAAITDRAVMAGATLGVMANGSDPDSPPQRLAYSLLNSPAGAVIDSATGIISWRPPMSAIGNSNLFRVVVTEGGFATNFSPVADTYVRDGTFAAINYGTETNLAVKYSTSAGFKRETFLRFDLAAVNGGIQSADLQLTPLSASSPGLQVVASVTNNAWGETALTWNTKPDSGAAAVAWLPQTGVPVSVPVPGLAQAALQLERLLSLRVFSTNLTADGLVSYGSREGAVASAPKLAVVYTNSLALSATQSFYVSVSAPPRPALTTSAAGPGQFQVSFYVTAGPDYVLEASTNLASWVPVFATNAPAVDYLQTCTDTEWFPMRFYRVRLGP